MSNNPELERFRDKIRELLEDISKLEARINEFQSTLTSLDAMSIELPSRLEKVRNRGYVFYSWIEDQLYKVVDKWMKLRHNFLEVAETVRKTYVPQLTSLRERCNKLLSISYTLSRTHWMRAENIEMSLESIKTAVEGLIENLERQAKNIESEFWDINSKVNMAEWTLNKLSTASFKLLDDENVLSCYKAKLMLEKDKPKGYLFITDKRLIFEAEKEIVLKKVLFIATKKKKVREIMYDIPIGYIANLTKGKVGFFERGGIFIEFKEGAPAKELTFDMDDREIDNFIRDVNYILSGTADKEKITREKEETKKLPTVIKCPICGAPVKREIVRGETSVKCEYCGAVINL